MARWCYPCFATRYRESQLNKPSEFQMNEVEWGRYECAAVYHCCVCVACAVVSRKCPSLPSLLSLFCLSFRESLFATSRSRSQHKTASSALLQQPRVYGQAHLTFTSLCHSLTLSHNHSALHRFDTADKFRFPAELS